MQQQQPLRHGAAGSKKTWMGKGRTARRTPILLKTLGEDGDGEGMDEPEEY
jgi:hypothetical protein